MDTNLIARVRTVLESSGLPNAAFAAAIATTPDKLSKSLAGSRKFTTTELALIAELADSTLDWLLTGSQKPTPAMAARTSVHGGVEQVTIEGLAARFTDASDQLTFLEESPRTLAGLPLLLNVWSAVAQGEALAAEALAQVRSAGFNVEPGSDLAAVAEAVFGTDVAVVEMPGGLDGCAWQTDQQRLILLNKTSNWARYRFTFGHELGHILAGDAQVLIAEDVTHTSNHESEMRASSFAAAFLMPEADVRERVTAELDRRAFIELVNHFRVSPSAMYFRLKNLKLANPECQAWSSMTAESCAVLGGVPELLATERNRSDARRLPPRLVGEHLKHFLNNQTSARPLATLLEMDPAEVIELVRPIAE